MGELGNEGIFTRFLVRRNEIGSGEEFLGPRVSLWTCPDPRHLTFCLPFPGGTPRPVSSVVLWGAPVLKTSVCVTVHSHSFLKVEGRQFSLHYCGWYSSRGFLGDSTVCTSDSVDLVLGPKSRPRLIIILRK